MWHGYGTLHGSLILILKLRVEYLHPQSPTEALSLRPPLDLVVPLPPLDLVVPLLVLARAPISSWS